jgi:hypothetical protein
VPRKSLADRSEDAESQRRLEEAHAAKRLPAISNTTNDLQNPDMIAARPSVTEHTTHHLTPKKS